MPPRPPSGPTHFLCIPLSSSQLARSLATFRADATSPSSFAVPEDAVRPLGTMHLTLGVMNLRGDATEPGVYGPLPQAVRLLRGLDVRAMLRSARSRARVEADGPLRVMLKGLEVLPQQDPARTSVLFAPPVDESGVLLGFCEALKAAFVSAGLMSDERRSLLLHATVVNTVYVRSSGRRRAGGGGKGGGRERLMLDARRVMDKYAGFEWMRDGVLDRVCVCKMGAKKVDQGSDERYEVVAEVNI